MRGRRGGEGGGEEREEEEEHTVSDCRRSPDDVALPQRSDREGGQNAR